MMLPSLQVYAAQDFALALSAKEVKRGGEIVVSGTAPDDASDVSVKIVSPNGTVFYLEAATPDSGRYSVNVIIPTQAEFAPYGEYTVAAGHRTLQKTSKFAVVEQLGGEDGGDGGDGDEGGDGEDGGNGDDGGNNGGGNPAPGNDVIPPNAGQVSRGTVKPELGSNGYYIAGRTTLGDALNGAGDSVTIELPASAAERGDSLEFPAQSLKAIEEGKKNIILNSGGLSMTFPAGSIGTYGTGDSRIRITVNTSWTSEAQDIVERSIASNESLHQVGMALSVVIELVNADGTTEIHEMKHPVTVSLKLTVEQENKLRLNLAGIYDVDGTQATYVRGFANNGVFTFDAEHFSYYAVLEYDKRFVDMANHWAEISVQSLAAQYIVTGVDELHYMPENIIKRADFATMLVRSLDWKGADMPEATKSAFTDVDMDSYYGNAVGIAAELGIVTGYNGKFRPNDLITREEAAVALARALPSFDLDAAQGSPSFGDQDDISAWAVESVREAWATGLIKGDDKGNFNPKRTLTRAQVAAMMDRALNQQS
jgi:hypothetical protein